jgi:hypothetical protein
MKAKAKKKKPTKKLPKSILPVNDFYVHWEGCATYTKCCNCNKIMFTPEDEANHKHIACTPSSRQ